MEVEDGRAFCPQCRAPQINVQVTIPDAGIDAGVNSAPDAFSPEILQAAHSARPLPSGTALDSGMAIRAAIKAGVLGVFFAILIMPLLGIVLAGGFAVYFYRRENGLAPPVAIGARLGGAAGVVLFAISALVLTVRIFVFHGRQEYVDFLAQTARTAGLNATDPESQAVIHFMFTPSGLAIVFFFVMIVAAVLASASGALASLLLRPRNPRG